MHSKVVISALIFGALAAAQAPSSSTDDRPTAITSPSHSHHSTVSAAESTIDTVVSTAGGESTRTKKGDHPTTGVHPISTLSPKESTTESGASTRTPKESTSETDTSTKTPKETSSQTAISTNSPKQDSTTSEDHPKTTSKPSLKTQIETKTSSTTQTKSDDKKSSSTPNAGAQPTAPAMVGGSAMGAVGLLVAGLVL